MYLIHFNSLKPCGVHAYTFTFTYLLEPKCKTYPIFLKIRNHIKLTQYLVKHNLKKIEILYYFQIATGDTIQYETNVIQCSLKMGNFQVITFEHVR